MSERIPSAIMAECLDAMAGMKQRWIADHCDGKDRRPEWVLTLAERDLSVLKQAAFEYRASAEKAHRMREAAVG